MKSTGSLFLIGFEEILKNTAGFSVPSTSGSHSLILPSPTLSFNTTGLLGQAKGGSWTIGDSVMEYLVLPKIAFLGLLGSVLVVCTMALAFWQSARHCLKSQPKKTWVLRLQPVVPAPPHVHTCGDKLASSLSRLCSEFWGGKICEPAS